jgi:WD40 repeat protein
MRAFTRWLIDLRAWGVLGALLALTLFSLPGSQPASVPTRPRVVPGERGVQVVSSAFSPQARQIVSVNTAGKVALRTSETEWMIDRFLDFPGFARDAAFTPDGRMLAAVGGRSTVAVWDLSASPNIPTTIAELPVASPRFVRYLPDGRSLVVAGSEDGTILIWDIRNRCARSVLRQSSPVVAMALAKDGTLLATAGRDDRDLFLWNLQTGACQVFGDGSTERTSALAFSPDRSLLASASLLGHQAHVWDLKTLRPRRVCGGHSRPVSSVAFSPDGAFLATAGGDGVVSLWAVETGKQRVILDAQAFSLRNLSFSPDGRTLALTTLNDDDLRLWDLNEGRGAFAR